MTAMLIKYRLATEHPVGKGALMFMVLCALFFVGVSVMHLGLYGYAMRWDSFIVVAMLFVFWGVGFEYGKVDDGWQVKVNWYGLTINVYRYENVDVVQDGKFFNLRFNVIGIFKLKSIDLPVKLNTGDTISAVMFDVIQRQLSQLQ